MSQVQQQEVPVDPKIEARDRVVKAFRECRAAQATIQLSRTVGALDEGSKVLGPLVPEVAKKLNQLLDLLDFFDGLSHNPNSIYLTPTPTDVASS